MKPRTSYTSVSKLSKSSKLSKRPDYTDENGKGKNNGKYVLIVLILAVAGLVAILMIGHSDYADDGSNRNESGPEYVVGAAGDVFTVVYPVLSESTGDEYEADIVIRELTAGSFEVQSISGNNYDGNLYYGPGEIDLGEIYRSGVGLNIVSLASNAANRGLFTHGETRYIIPSSVTSIGAGWFSLDDLTLDPGNPNYILVDGRLKTKTPYSVTYDLNGGTGTTPPVNVSSDTVNLHNGPGISKLGFILTGWNTNASGTGVHYRLGSTCAFPSSVTLYAEWLEYAEYVGYPFTTTDDKEHILDLYIRALGGNTFEIVKMDCADIYYGDAEINLGGVYWMGSNVIITSLKDKSNMGNPFVHGSITFRIPSTVTSIGNSWFNLGYETYAEVDPANQVYESVNGKIQHKGGGNPASYTITYNSNGGSGSITSQTGNGNVNLSSGSGFSRAGYNLTGWRAGSASGTHYDLGKQYNLTANVTMYAEWTLIPTYTVSYNANGGSGSAPSQTGVADYIYLDSGSGMLRSGYTLTGWRAGSASGTHYDLSKQYYRSSNVTMYAEWTVNSFSADV